jgi:hypothetical protein
VDKKFVDKKIRRIKKPWIKSVDKDDDFDDIHKKSLPYNGATGF